MSIQFVEESNVFSYEKIKNRWFSVNEKLPDKDTLVLVYGGKGMYVAQCFDGRNWYRVGSKNHYCNPKYWMYLPDPPVMQNSAKL